MSNGGWEGGSCGDILDSCSEAVTILLLPLDVDIVGLVDATLVLVLRLVLVGLREDRCSLCDPAEAGLIVPLETISGVKCSSCDPAEAGLIVPLDAI